jgi:hypothetical protein
MRPDLRRVRTTTTTKKPGDIMGKREEELSKEIPQDQVWVENPEFERQLYDPSAPLVDFRPITAGPSYHWFSYYDKFQTDPTDRFALAMEIDFEGRSPTPDDILRIGMVDLESGNEWVPLGETRAWCWQQGCMLQWRPGSTDEILWNDREQDRFVTRILNVNTRELRTVDHPIYHVHPAGAIALSTDFPRIQLLRPGYGYPGIPDTHAEELTPAESSIYELDLATGATKPLITVEQIAQVEYPDRQPEDDKHYFNNPAWNPDGSRFLFLNRWRSVRSRFPDFRTRMFTLSPEGSELLQVTDQPGVSHFTWRDAGHIGLWREGAYRLYKDDGSYDEQIILRASNGHLTYLPDADWMIADTYHDKDGNQNPFLYHIPSGTVKPLAHLFTPSEYRGGEFRCDLHPRLARSATRVIVDSVHGGNGRQMYIADIGELVD